MWLFRKQERGGRKCVGRYSLVYQRGLTGPTPTPPLNSSKSVETFLSKCSAPKIFGFYINWRHIWYQTKVILYLAVGSWNYSSLALALQWKMIKHQVFSVAWWMKKGRSGAAWWSLTTQITSKWPKLLEEANQPTRLTPLPQWLGGWWVWKKKTPFFLQLDLELWARIRDPLEFRSRSGNRSCGD